MTEIQKDLIRKYLNSSLFPRDNKCADGKKFLKSANNSSNLKLSDEGKYLCAYGGLFGLGSKIKEVAFLQKTDFTSEKAKIVQ